MQTPHKPAARTTLSALRALCGCLGYVVGMMQAEHHRHISTKSYPHATGHISSCRKSPSQPQTRHRVKESHWGPRTCYKHQKSTTSSNLPKCLSKSIGCSITLVANQSTPTHYVSPALPCTHFRSTERTACRVTRCHGHKGGCRTPKCRTLKENGGLS